MYTITIPLVDPAKVRVPSGDNITIEGLIFLILVIIAVFTFVFYKKYKEDKQ